jgi:hypothetical protein
MKENKNHKLFRIIALYLPQFYPIPENDEWWGKGFTEWTNVRQAKPLFRGHYQPRVPADLGYYDLRVPETRQAQADMAKAYGVEGFCYWHYWFGNGKRLLERTFNEVLTSGKPDFPFCLGWANHSWYEKLWTIGVENKLLCAQTYPGVEDYTEHFYSVLPAFQDKRYITVDGKPFFLIFDPFDSPELKTFVETWRKLAIENGLQGIYFVGQSPIEAKDKVLRLGFDAVNDVSISAIYNRLPLYMKVIHKAKVLLFNMPRVFKYKDAMKYFCNEESKKINVLPSICPNWDHSPRSGAKGFILTDSEPNIFRDHVVQVLNLIKDKPSEKRIAILKSWNEWGEGNYIEPDIKYGKSYLEALKDAIDKL